ncbi:uncharacterized protein IUM83_13823 [Phytophthora cinnamomi]|uniref:uncharacterized protein n=1 Tax=Phytophthora cinnamomi TaxID=4785 RepID=UPI00355A16C8|nr:hypothetical protein IUM83_13823 [Phytophthora cinnamomi]
MARTRVAVVAQTARSVTGTQTRTKTVPVPAGRDEENETADVRGDAAEDDEMKDNDPTDENNPGNARGYHDAGDASGEPRDQATDGNDNDGGVAMAPVAALTVALQQMVATVARIDARLDQLSTATTATTRPSTGTDGRAPTTMTTTTRATATPEPPQQPTSTTSPPASRSTPTTGMSRRTPPAATERRVAYQPRDDGDDGDASSNDDDSSSSSDSDDDSSAGNDDGGRRGRRQPVTMPGDRDFQRNRRRTIRDLDLPTFLPTPQTSVTTWIARVDLALEGARLSGRGDWANEELYYILGNKLQDSAARWWVQLDRKLRDNERTWTRLKSSLLRRYGERPDKSMAEWRVTQRRMMPVVGLT